MDAITDPVALLHRLDADAIATRLDEIGREEKALRVLLRSARARQRRDSQRPSQQSSQGGDHAA